MQSNRPKTAREMGIMSGFPPPPEKRPTLENWDLAPFNRWSFQNMRSLFPTVDVARSTLPASELKVSHGDVGAIRFIDHDGREISVNDWIGNSYTDGVLVMSRGRILLEHYENEFGPRIAHLSQSVAKSLIGMLAGILYDEGLFDLDAPLGSLVPEMAECGYADCTMDQALDMQSGVQFTEDYGVPWSDMTRIDVASGWRPVRQGEIRPTIRDVVLSLPKIRPHGEQFEYRSIETDVVAWALERVAGDDIASLVSSRIWGPMGAEENGFFTVDQAKTALADGGFNATMRDYGRLGLIMARDGVFNDRQIVPASWVKGIKAGGDSSKFAPLTSCFLRMGHTAGSGGSGIRLMKLSWPEGYLGN